MIAKIAITQPSRLVFGRNCSNDCAPYLRRSGVSRVFLVTSPPTQQLAETLAESLRQEGLKAEVYAGVDREPSVPLFTAALDAAKAARPDGVIGIGGGSALDVAKLVAALVTSDQSVRDLFGIDLLACRSTFLACLPTTAGTGSEVSPNAILLDEGSLKQGVISPYLVPDATFVDPMLTVSMPPAVTAGTGLDALTHCIEAYTNRFSHPIIDIYALEGIRLIAANLPRAVANGTDLEARESVALGSMYGGLCLGPVNTAGVHALSYPLGGEFHVAHGVSNAVLLPHVMEFNLRACPERYAKVAAALGAEWREDPVDMAFGGVQRVHQIASQCGIPMNLADLNVPRSAIPHMADAAVNVKRLLKNNPREINVADATRIYEQAFQTRAGGC